MQQEINTVKSKIDDTVMEQEAIDKKVSNVQKSQEKLKIESDEIKAQSEALSLEIVDLQIGKYIFLLKFYKLKII